MKKKGNAWTCLHKAGSNLSWGEIRFTQPHSYKALKGSETNSYLPFTSACQWFFIESWRWPHPPPTANNTVWELERIVGSQTFTAENAARERAKWPLRAGCSVRSESIINAALLAVSALSPLAPSGSRKINEGCVSESEVRLQLRCFSKHTSPHVKFHLRLLWPALMSEPHSRWYVLKTGDNSQNDLGLRLCLLQYNTSFSLR